MARTYLRIPALTPQDIARFWSKVEIKGPDECWPWKAATDKDGYGKFQIGRRTNYRAHRVAYFLATGRDPGDQLVCHRCDNPPCCNGGDLFTGDELANTQDSCRKGRRARCGPTNPARGARNGKQTHPERTPRGERAGRAKLKRWQAQEIYNRMCAGESPKVLAHEFSVCRSLVRAIHKGIIWSEIDRRPVLHSH